MKPQVLHWTSGHQRQKKTTPRSRPTSEVHFDAEKRSRICTPGWTFPLNTRLFDRYCLCDCGVTIIGMLEDIYYSHSIPWYAKCRGDHCHIGERGTVISYCYSLFHPQSLGYIWQCFGLSTLSSCEIISFSIWGTSIIGTVTVQDL